MLARRHGIPLVCGARGSDLLVPDFFDPDTDQWHIAIQSWVIEVDGLTVQFLTDAGPVTVVENDTLVRNYVLTQLHSLGYVTLDAANATDAMGLAHTDHRFDLLFTDVIMPGLNGRQLANEILKVRPDLKVLFTSGYTENAIIHHGRLDEGVLLLAKPYRKSDMAIMIRKALGD